MTRELNETLKRVYAIVPSIGAWARTGLPSPLWATDQEASRAVLSYVGPAVDPLISSSFHYSKDDLAFLATPEVVDVVLSVVKQIYSGRNCLDNGFFPEDADDARP